MISGQAEWRLATSWCWDGRQDAVDDLIQRWPELDIRCNDELRPCHDSPPRCARESAWSYWEHGWNQETADVWGPFIPTIHWCHFERVPAMASNAPSLCVAHPAQQKLTNWSIIAIMHAAVESDVYNGHYIPKGMRLPHHLLEIILIYSTGAIISPNIW